MAWPSRLPVKKLRHLLPNGEKLRYLRGRVSRKISFLTIPLHSQLIPRPRRRSAHSYSVLFAFVLAPIVDLWQQPFCVLFTGYSRTSRRCLKFARCPSNVSFLRVCFKQSYCFAFNATALYPREGSTSGSVYIERFQSDCSGFWCPQKRHWESAQVCFDFLPNWNDSLVTFR